MAAASSVLEYRPAVILLLSGKRKSGKDFIADRIFESLQSELGPGRAKILRLSGPLKKEYAKSHGLDYQELLTDSGYKEIHRQKMVTWGEEMRKKDPGYFCRAAVAEGRGISFWIVSDCRRKTDVQFFDRFFSSNSEGGIPRVMKIRIEASEDSRAGRGWVFTPGIDDGETECDLDAGVSWDRRIRNEGEGGREAVEALIAELLATFRVDVSNADEQLNYSACTKEPKK